MLNRKSDLPVLVKMLSVLYSFLLYRKYRIFVLCSGIFLDFKLGVFDIFFTKYYHYGNIIDLSR